MELQNGSYQSPRWTFEILDCSMPMTFDTYSNCAFQCLYCFSFFQRAVGEGANDYMHHKVQSVDVEKVKRLFRGEIPKSSFNWYIQRKMVLQWGGLSDGWDHYEKKFGKSLELLRFFREIDYPISISTKGVWFMDHPEYVEAFRDAKNVHVKSSIISLDEDKVHRLERGVATSEERFRMLEKMNELGVGGTTVRYRPFTLGISADYPYTNTSREQIWAFVRRAKAAGCYSLTSEFLCLESRASNTAHERYELISQIAGFDQFKLYKERSQARSGLFRLSYELKRPYFETMQEACDAVGLKFFISDAHHKEKSAGAGCCGLPSEGPLSNINRGQYAEAILIAKRNGRVHWSDIAEAADGLKNIRYYAAEGFNVGTTQSRANRIYQNMWEYMRDVWNNPKSMMSPNRYFGGALIASEMDEAGDIIYLYNEPFVVRGEVPASLVALQETLTAQGIAMGEDGSEYGHVAYPVAVNAVGVFPAKVLAFDQMHRNRLVARLFVSKGTAAAWEKWFPDGDIAEVGPEGMRHLDAEQAIQFDYTQEGTDRIWLVEHDALFVDTAGNHITPRAFLSTLEKAIENGLQPGLDALHHGTRLVLCATPDHEVVA